MKKKTAKTIVRELNMLRKMLLQFSDVRHEEQKKLRNIMCEYINKYCEENNKIVPFLKYYLVTNTL